MTTRRTNALSWKHRPLPTTGSYDVYLVDSGGKLFDNDNDNDNNDEADDDINNIESGSSGSSSNKTPKTMTNDAAMSTTSPVAAIIPNNIPSATPLPFSSSSSRDHFHKHMQDKIYATILIFLHSMNAHP
jgi:hypothetical protein